jgi:hypothetical protein
MTKKDLEAFSEIMSSLNEIYGDQQKGVSDLKMKLYFESLRDLTIDQLNHAVVILSRTKKIKTFPLPAEIIEAAVGNAEDEAEAAFEVLLGVIQNIGPYRSVEFQDGIIGRVVEQLGGWEAVNDWAEVDRKWNRKNFCELYRSFVRRGVSSTPVKCVGIHENTNVNNKAIMNKEYDMPKPVQIGEQKRLKLVSGEK